MNIKKLILILCISCYPLQISAWKIDWNKQISKAKTIGMYAASLIALSVIANIGVLIAAKSGNEWAKRLNKKNQFGPLLYNMFIKIIDSSAETIPITSKIFSNIRN